MDQLHNDNCFKILPTIKENSIDLILTDLPYGTTACKWDVVLPFEPMWKEIKRIVKDNTCIAFTGTEPFSSHLRLSNLSWYKYDWVWNKKRITAPFLAKKQPLRQHELVSIFYKKQCNYNPQPTKKNTSKPFTKNEMTDGKGEVYGGMKRKGPRNENEYGYPKTILNDIKVITNMSKEKFVHPTQKPVQLMEYFIKTYTHENDTVLDFTMGSGTTGVACKKLNRNFIGIELDKNYFNIACKRIEEEPETQGQMETSIQEF